MRLWIESAHQCLTSAAADDAARTCTFQSEERFCAILAGQSIGAVPGQSELIRRAVAMLEQGAVPETARDVMAAQLPEGGHVPVAMLCANLVERANTSSREAARADEYRVWLFECDAPPLFLMRGGRSVLLPVQEEEARGHLVRTCDFTLQDGDCLAIVDEEFIQPRGRGRRWGWQEIAASVRRWTDTGCDAGQLLSALLSTYTRAAQVAPAGVCVIAMHVRPLRSVTVWSGPPGDPAQDAPALARLIAEQGTRVICGDTTAHIAARLLGARMELEPRPEDGWADIPPVSHLHGVDLVTEGLVTLSRAREHIAQAAAASAKGSSLPRGADGAARLARLLWAADRVQFLLGQAVNPVQAADAAGTVPMRRVVVDELVRDLRAQGKMVSVETL